MTCIVGIVDDDHHVLLGGDAGATGPREDSQVRKDPKVWRSGEYVMGVTGSFRQLDIMRHIWKPPMPNTAGDQKGFMVRVVVPSLRACLENNGLSAAQEDAAENPLPGPILIGLRGHLFELEPDYQVSEGMDPYWAIGMGDHAALGALHTLFWLADPPQVRIMLHLALVAAEYFSAPVRGPFTIVSTK